MDSSGIHSSPSHRHNMIIKTHAFRIYPYFRTYINYFYWKVYNEIKIQFGKVGLGVKLLDL